MSHTLRIISAQLNFHVGDLEKNLQMHITTANKARSDHHADLIVFPELSLTGYPPEDLLLRKAFIAACDEALHKIAKSVRDIYCIVGHPVAESERLYNACSVLHNGHIIATYKKFHLPNYGVFDEKRYFESRDEACVININDIAVGIVICEDIWSPGPLAKSKLAGADIVVVPNASPFVTDKHEQRLTLLAQQARAHHLPIIYVNNVGGQDELVFDGGSMVVDTNGKMSHFSGFFNETLTAVCIRKDEHKQVSIEPDRHSTAIPHSLQRIYQALVLGTRDYVNKNNFPGVMIGLSGGIDSALCAAIAVDALGKERVHGVFMPSQFTSELSCNEVAAITRLLGIHTVTLSIKETYAAFLATLSSQLVDGQNGVTEQNIQARCRANLIMALSNKTGNLVITTGNRSELAVGYCTLYGDMAGGYAILKNVPKTLVYQLAEYRNQLGAVIPDNTITREPTAELAPNQKDQDTLPPYDLLDEILECYLNQGMSVATMIAGGLDAATVTRVVALIRRNEYKRKQYAVGPQVFEHSFIKDWRYPITNGFHE